MVNCSIGAIAFLPNAVKNVFDKHYFPRLSLPLQCKTLLTADMLLFCVLLSIFLHGLYCICVLRCDSASVLCLKASFFFYFFFHTMKRQPHLYSIFLNKHNKRRNREHDVVALNYIKYTVTVYIKNCI